MKSEPDPDQPEVGQGGGPGGSEGVAAEVQPQSFEAAASGQRSESMGRPLNLGKNYSLENRRG